MRMRWETIIYVIALFPVLVLTGLVAYLISAALFPAVTKMPAGFKVLIAVLETALLTTLFLYIVKKRIEGV